MRTSTAPFAVVVLPYAVELDGAIAYAVFRDAAGGDGAWHVLGGRGMNGEVPLEGARRVAWQRAAIPPDAAYLALDSRRAVAVSDRAMVAEHAFAVRVCADELHSRRAELEHHWVAYEIAQGLLHREADLDALWELRRRLGHPATCC